MKIKLLSNDTIQKISAGEVIENPCAVVKELVENSIDSGASTIKVQIKSAGKTEILVSDDGMGIDEKEIELAFLKNATSKIQNFDDLYSIFSYGFRGEALSSISAISKINIKTRTKNSDIGIHATIENSKIIKKNKIGMNIGTTIQVKDLFYNVPIRKKFLKSDAYENNLITNIMYSFALSSHGVSVKFIKDDRVIFETNKNNTLEDNINLILGKDFADKLIKINIVDTDYKIYGFITNNHFYRSTRSNQFLYV